MDWTPILLSARLAAISTALLLLVGVPLSRWIALSRGAGATAVRALIQIPMVLPPTVTGFYLLTLFSPASAFGGFLRAHGIELLFHFEGLVVASVLTGLPFLSSPVVAGFQTLPPHLREASLCLGRSPWTTFWKLELPLVAPSVLAGAILAFLHALGEFGVVLMLGGKMPGETYTVSIQLFDLVEQMDLAAAHRLALGLTGVSFAGLVVLFLLQKRRAR